ncbi:MAG TPA: response regulator transcription factor [Terracidiphilus sp.]|jgi:DNA-binding response OmpR family regulator
MNEQILIVEDEQELCMTLGDRLRSEGYGVEFAFDGKVGLEKITQRPFDLFVLDIMLPLRSGLDLCTDIRRIGLTTPILLLTALSQTVEKVAGLKSGADDYVTKPFSTLELMARVEALLRRSPNRSDPSRNVNQDVYYLGTMQIDVRKGKVLRDGQHINLTSREFQLLQYLVEHRGSTVSREELLEHVWGHIAGTLTRTVDMHIASLRQKIESSPKRPEMIITVPGSGYKFQG